jgi:hypothetical protein
MSHKDSNINKGSGGGDSSSSIAETGFGYLPQLL